MHWPCFQARVIACMYASKRVFSCVFVRASDFPDTCDHDNTDFQKLDLSTWNCSGAHNQNKRSKSSSWKKHPEHNYYTIKKTSQKIQHALRLLFQSSLSPCCQALLLSPTTYAVICTATYTMPALEQGFVCSMTCLSYRSVTPHPVALSFPLSLTPSLSLSYH